MLEYYIKIPILLLYLTYLCKHNLKLQNKYNQRIPFNIFQTHKNVETVYNLDLVKNI